MGMMPMHIPTFSRIWKVHMATQPTSARRQKSDSVFMASRSVATIIHR